MIGITNYWKTSNDRHGLYFELFSVSSDWNPISSHPHFTIVLLNIEICFTFKFKGVKTVWKEVDD